MLGLIFLTWEKYLTERFGNALLRKYRAQMGETAAAALVASRYYDDALMEKGVGIVSQLTHIPADMLLREYGRYFVANALTGKLCTYLLSQVHSGRELLLAMRDTHARLRTAFEGATPPVFEYGASSRPDEVIVIYRSPRKLCAVLHGTIEGAALRYHEGVHVVEYSCMKRGAEACRFAARFFPDPRKQSQWEEQDYQQRFQKQLADLILSALPFYGRQKGWTLAEIQALLNSRGLHAYYQRPAVVLEAVQHLQFAGLIISNANDRSAPIMARSYWRIPHEAEKASYRIE